jgi:hypothetical protein
MNKVIVPTDRVEEEFTQYLDLGDNERIIFSGKFGSGKTTFLNSYFDARYEKYLTIKLYPVHYSVSLNEDIFEFIKFDIIFQLLAQNIIQEGAKFSNGELAMKFIAKRLYPSLAKFIRFIPVIGKDISGILETIKEIIKEAEEFKKKENKNEYTEATAFLNAIEEQIGSPYERNRITELINNFLDYAKKQRKKTVLLIDDFDRIDPEHTFRLLNVFASQCDNDFNGGKKFLFDHIVIVCDIDNIRNIYHHKYGMNTDFTGYIDKFYSKQIFNFDIRSEFVDRLLKFLSPLINKYNKDSNYSFETTFIKIICLELIKLGEINLRHAHNIGIIRPLSNSYTINDVTISPSMSGIMLLNILAALFDEQGLNTLIEKYNALNIMYVTSGDYMNLANSLLEVCIKDSPNKDSKRGEYVIQDYKYTYSMDAGDNVWIEKVSMLTGNEVQSFPLWQIMKCANDVRRRYMATGVVR